MKKGVFIAIFFILMLLGGCGNEKDEFTSQGRKFKQVYTDEQKSIGIETSSVRLVEDECSGEPYVNVWVSVAEKAKPQGDLVFITFKMKEPQFKATKTLAGDIEVKPGSL